MLILLVGLPALAGCGGGGKPPIAPAVAQRLANQADALAASAGAGDACAAARHATALQTATRDAINAHAIPPRYQEELMGRANELVAELQASCLPSPAPAATTPAPAPAPAPPPAPHGKPKPPEHPHGHDHGPGHDHGDKRH